MLLQLDLFPKSDRSYRSRGTTSGGYATLISYLIAAALLRYEALTWYDHRNRSYPPPSPSSPASSPSPLSLTFSPFTETVVVHRRLDRRLGATVNVTFPNVYSSRLISADYVDIGGGRVSALGIARDVLVRAGEGSDCSGSLVGDVGI